MKNSISFKIKTLDQKLIKSRHLFKIVPAQRNLIVIKFQTL